MGKFIAAFSETVASGPYFKVMMVNLVPYQVLQPWVDAAFKKRGIDPEDFWRSAGLPAFRFPDPNGTRFPNGAPPPAPPALEGTPDHPGPAVPAGIAVFVCPAAGLLPRPDNPMPCAASLKTRGRSGPRGLLRRCPTSRRRRRIPMVCRPTPGIPIAGRPGAPAPNLPGTPVPLPPKAPPGARTEGVRPAGRLHRRRRSPRGCRRCRHRRRARAPAAGAIRHPGGDGG